MWGEGMTKILVCNQKGGVGKSLIADELTFSFERSKIPVAFLDLDSQGGTIHKTDQREDAEVAVIDTPGALQEQFGQWIADADMVIIPTRTTSRDIEPLQRMQRLVSSNARKGVPVVYVLNGWNRWRASSDFLDWFKSQAGGGTICKLPQSEQFVQASAAGMSVVEYARISPAAVMVKDLCNRIRKLAGFKAE